MVGPHERFLLQTIQTCWIIFSGFWCIPCLWLFGHAIFALCHPLETLLSSIVRYIIISEIANLQWWLKAHQCAAESSIVIMFRPRPPPEPDEIHKNLCQILVHLWKISWYPLSFQLLLVLPLVFRHSNMLLILAYSFSGRLLIATLQWWLEALRSAAECSKGYSIKPPSPPDPLINITKCIGNISLLWMVLWLFSITSSTQLIARSIARIIILWFIKNGTRWVHTWGAYVESALDALGSRSADPTIIPCGYGNSWLVEETRRHKKRCLKHQRSRITSTVLLFLVATSVIEGFEIVSTYHSKYRDIYCSGFSDYETIQSPDFLTNNDVDQMFSPSSDYDFSHFPNNPNQAYPSQHQEQQDDMPSVSPPSIPTSNLSRVRSKFHHHLEQLRQRIITSIIARSVPKKFDKGLWAMELDMWLLEQNGRPHSMLPEEPFTFQPQPLLPPLAFTPQAGLIDEDNPTVDHHMFDMDHQWWNHAIQTFPLLSSVMHASVRIEFMHDEHNWRHRRKLRRVSVKIARNSHTSRKSHAIPPPSPPVPKIIPIMTLAARMDWFLSDFNPAIAARAMTSPLIAGGIHFTPATLQISGNLPHPTPVSTFSQVLPAILSYLPAFRCHNNILTTEQYQLIVDTGASVCITPCRSDFISYRPSKVKIKDLSKSNSVEGEGVVRWVITDSEGKPCTIELPGYHIPNADIKLLSPQVLLALNGGQLIQTAKNITISLDDGPTFEANYHPSNNLPYLKLAETTKSSFWANTFDVNDLSTSDFTRVCNIMADNNINMSAAQKEVALWHHRLSHVALPVVQTLMANRRWTIAKGGSAKECPIIKCKQKRGPVCDIKDMKCPTCQMAKQHRRSTTNQRVGAKVQAQTGLKQDNLRPGDCISCDHYNSPIAGRLWTSYGKEKQGFNGGTLYVDHASGKIFNKCQISLRAGETIRGKMALEALARDSGHSIKAFQTDNGVFASKEFKTHCEARDQKIKFSGVGGHHQNGVAEKGIKTISQWARANLIHLSLHWGEKDTIRLWPMALEYAIWVYNRLPSMSGFTPDEIWTGVRSDHEELQRAHVFGCPVYVLDPKLQDGHKIPKWNPRSRVGMFVGFSNQHSSLVPLVLNLKTGKISPQYHIIFDDKFQTVASPAIRSRPIDDIWHQLYQRESEYYLDIELDENGRNTAPTPDLHDDWLDADEVNERNERRERLLAERNSRPPQTTPRSRTAPPNRDPTPTQAKPVQESRRTVSFGEDTIAYYDPQEHEVEAIPVTESEGVHDSEGAQDPEGVQVSEGAESDEDINPNVEEYPNENADSAGAQPVRKSSRHRDHSYKDGPAKYDRNRNKNEFVLPKWRAATSILALTTSQLWGQPPPTVANNARVPSAFHPTTKVSKAYLSEVAYLRDTWEDLRIHLSEGNIDYTDLAEIDYWQDDEDDGLELNFLSPHVLAAKTQKRDEDNPTWSMAMNGPFAEEYYAACRTELDTLQKIEAWDIVKIPKGVQPIQSTWAFKCKRFPDGTVKKFKARFCVMGNRQTYGVDFFETWSPVVQWSTIRLMMVLSAKLGLKSAQADITAAFLHATLEKGEDIYVRQPRGFVGDPSYCYKLKRALYGLRQAPRYFFEHLKKRIEVCGAAQSHLDPCLFIGPQVIVITYVDDLLIYSRDSSNIQEFISNMKKAKIDLREEGTAEGFLGVNIERDERNKTITLTQSGLSKRVIEALGLCASNSVKCSTPAETSALPKDADGEMASGAINYPSVVGMLLYLSGHSRPDIAFAVHQCARYTFQPRLKHEIALKRIGRYLKGTVDKGIIMSPSDDMGIECYPDADFAGLWSHENPQDPHCARSRTGFVIRVAQCPVIWASKLQTEITLSTMEAEYVAMSMACKTLFPIIDMVRDLGEKLGLDVDDKTKFFVKIHEDNVGALTLGRLEPRRMTPRSKHYAIKYHWFREQIGPRGIALHKIESAEQLGDIFTKGLGPLLFQNMREKLMGW